MRPRISIRGSVRPSVGPSVRRSVGNAFFSNPRKRVLTAEMDGINFMVTRGAEERGGAGSDDG